MSPAWANIDEWLAGCDVPAPQFLTHIALSPKRPCPIDPTETTLRQQASGDTRRGKRPRIEMPTTPPDSCESAQSLPARSRLAQPSISPSKRIRSDNTQSDNTYGASGGVGGWTTDSEICDDGGDHTTPRPQRSIDLSVTSEGSPFKRLKGGYKTQSGLRNASDDADSSASASAHGSISSSHSERTSRGSPQKQTMRLLINSNVGMKTASLKDLLDCQSLPRDLEDLLMILSDAQDGVGILTEADRETLRAELSGTRLSKRWLNQDSHFDDERRRHGPTPSLRQVQGLVAAAADCAKRQCEEMVWNLEVHHRALHIVLRPDNICDTENLIRFQGCQSAALNPIYHDTQDKKNNVNCRVDFCIFVDPENDPTFPLSALRHVQRLLPSNIVNQSNHFSLASFPLAVFIETKSASGDANEAANQLLVWQRAHFSFLNHLIAIAQEHAARTKRDLPDDLKRPTTWLPGLIALGHKWHFCPATMDDNGKLITRWYGEEHFGSTTGELQAYQLFVGLQAIQQWVEMTFWPWFRRLILYISE